LKRILKFTNQRTKVIIDLVGVKIRNLLFLAILLTSCGKFNPQGQKSQGIITYKVTYLQSDLKNISPSLLPKIMTQKYRQHMSVNSIEGFIGAFTLSNISDAKKRTNTTVLRVMGKGYTYSGPSGDYGCCFDPFTGMVITYQEGRKKIAGCDCEKAIATFPNIKPDTFEIWYTKDLGVEVPNINNPFSEIDGVLLEFNMHLKKLSLRLEAEKIEHVSVPWSDFKVPEGYRACTKQRMEDILNALLE
jgi:hypothetical protein